MYNAGKRNYADIAKENTACGVKKHIKVSGVPISMQ